MQGFAAVLGESSRFSASAALAPLAGPDDACVVTSGPLAAVGPRAGVAASGGGGPWAALCGEIASEAGFLRGAAGAAELLAFARSRRGGLPDGWYAGCVVDAERRHAFLYTDRLGQQPLYYGRVGGVWLVATELKAFAASDPSGFTRRRRGRDAAELRAGAR